MRVISLAAGAAGMLCGSCLRDNRLAAVLRAMGRDLLLVPLYTPIRTDDEDVSEPRVLFGGLNVYLAQRFALWRRVPRFLVGWLDSPRVLGLLGRVAASTRPAQLGALTLAVLEGERGVLRREVEHMVRQVALLRPDLVSLPNLMFAGMARSVRQRLGVPVVCTLGGEDIFLDALPPPYRERAIETIAQQAGAIDGFIGVTHYYARHAAQRFRVPVERIGVAPLGIRIDREAGDEARPVRAGGPFNVSYVARICPEKGLAQLVQAVGRLRSQGRDVRLRAAGWLGAADRPYLRQVLRGVREQGIDGAFEYLGEVDRAAKFALLRSSHAFSVPSEYPEAKGLPVLEAMSAGVPVVQPRHGSFPELIEATGGGLLYDPGGPEALAQGLARLMDDEPLRQALGARGRLGVAEHYSERRMADATWSIWERVWSAARAAGAVP